MRLTCLLITLLLPLCPASAAPPNVILILADDLGIGNVGCYGSDHCKTPNIDHLAATGTRFTHAFTGALCGPSRALIMSGRYAFRNGASNQDASTAMPLRELQLGLLFKKAGYATASIGKWGQLPAGPEAAGFDESLRFKGSGVYWSREADHLEPYWINGEEHQLATDEYMPDLMHQRAAAFLKANRTRPFFLYYPMSHVHGDIQPTPDSKPDSKDLFTENVLYMDKLAGKLIAELEALDLRGNTLILFMGDNGTAKGQQEYSTIGGRNLSGMKGSMQEGGGLVPFIANWPGKTPSGKVCQDLIDSTDLLTTFSALTGTPLPSGTVFDGHSFAPQLEGQTGHPREWIFNQLASMWYVREARWKLNQLGELYDMSGAPFEEKLVPTGSTDGAATAARSRLAAVLSGLNPGGGIPDSGDGTGRHASRSKKKAREN